MCDERCNHKKDEPLMKQLHLRPSRVNRIPNTSVPAATSAAAAEVSSGLALVRHRNRTMRTQVREMGDGFGARNLRGLWVALSGLVKRGESHCHTATSGGREGASVFPPIALQPTVSLPLEKPRLSSRRMDGGQVLRSPSGRHLWLVLRSEEHRRGALWETAGFLAIWLSGLIGVAICVL